MSETVRLSQRQMAGLFQKDVRTINKHIWNIFDGEIAEDSVIRKFQITAADGGDYLDDLLAPISRIRRSGKVFWRDD